MKHVNPKLQFHILFASPLHNMNRDEDGQVKTAEFGGVGRGRVSSQARKRAIRFSSQFGNCSRSVRTREAGLKAFLELRSAGIHEATAIKFALAVNVALGGSKDKVDDKAVADLLAKEVKKATDEKVKAGMEPADAREHALLRALRTENGVVVTTVEFAALDEAIEAVVAAKTAGKEAETVDAFVARAMKAGLLSKDRVDDDTLLFGRMVASKPEFNVDAACAISHAVTTHEFSVQGDYFSAGEEMNLLGEKGAAITAYAFFGAGVYYQHAVLDVRQIAESTGSDAARAERLVRSFFQGLVFAMPGGMRNAHASDVPASYVLVGAGGGETFNQMIAFLRPVQAGHNSDLLIESMDRLPAAVQASYGRPVESLAFNGYPLSWEGRNSPVPETHNLEDLERFVVDYVLAQIGTPVTA